MPASLAASSALAHGRRVRRATAMPSTLLAIRSSTICTCSSPPPCSPRADVQALDLVGPISASAFLQPSRAWSKNGLFMFFGTSAKVQLVLRLRRPRRAQRRQHRRGDRGTQSTASSLSYPPFVVHELRPSPLSARHAACPRIRSSSTARTMKTPTKAPCQLESTPAISRLLRITSISAAPMNAPIGAALAAHQVGAADHGRGDDAQLVARAERVDGRALPADDQHRRERRRQARRRRRPAS